jgi:hypothetical protein
MSKSVSTSIMVLRILSSISVAIIGLFLWLALISTMNRSIEASARVAHPETGQNVAFNCPADMIAYWELNETTGTTFKDSIGGNEGTCIEPSCPSPVEGIVKGAYNFSGSSEIDIPTLSDDFRWDGTSNFSIALWLKLPEAETCPGTRTALSRYVYPRSWWVGCSEDETAMFSLRDSNRTTEVAIGTTKINDGQWHYIVSVLDGAQDMMYLYVNGALESSVSKAFDGDWISNEKATVGYHRPAPYYYLVGAIDEVAVFNRALALAEIQYYYSNGLIGKGYCRSFELAVHKVGEGTVIADPPGFSYDYGQEVLLTAVAAPNWSFSVWSGAITGSENAATVVMTSSKSVSATFVHSSYLVYLPVTIKN